MAGVGTRRPIKLVDHTPQLVNGEWEPQEVTLYRGWADVKKKSGSRDQQNNQTVFGKFFELRFRFQGDITLNANVKLVYGGNTLTVHSIEREKEKSFYWILRAEAKAFE